MGSTTGEPELTAIPLTRIRIPFGKESINFTFSFEGPGRYQETAGKVLNREAPKLSTTTGEETALLLHASYQGPEEIVNLGEISEVRRLMESNYLWVFNRNLWTKEGVYVLSDPSGAGINPNFDRSLATFVPKEYYNLGVHSPESWVKDGFVIATFSKRGAELTGKLSKSFGYHPETWGIDIAENDRPIQRVSTVQNAKDRLSLVGIVVDYDNKGFAIGVSK